MNLNGLLSFGSKSAGGRRTEDVERPVVSPGRGAGSTDGKGAESIKNLQQGQTVQGEIISKNGREVQIMIDKDLIFTARLERDIQLQIGQNMTFEVKSNVDAQIALRPLFENLAQNESVLKALEEARLPASNEMVHMVTAMMEQGMSVDKNALNEMSRIVLGNPGADVGLLVSIKGLNLPVTEENITQFQAYTNYEHQLMHEITDIVNDIPKMMETLIQKGDFDGASQFCRQLIALFGSGAGTKNQVLFADTEGGSVLRTALQEGMPVPESVKSNAAADAVLRAVVTEGLEQVPTAEAVQTNTALGKPFIEQNLQLVQETAEATNGEMKYSNPGSVPEPLFQLLNTQERGNLVQQLSSAGFPEALLGKVADGSMDSAQLLQELAKLLSEAGHLTGSDKLNRLLTGKELGSLLKHQILNQWLLMPEAVAKRENVAELYSRLQKQTAKLTDIISQAARDTPLLKSVSVLQSNLNFMNQLNQVFQYIQLPLRMSEQNAHGELYVYKRKKNTLKEDGSVSALLHLDLDHIGSMDIHVTMKEQNVTTKFYLEEESLIDFIADHIYLLDEKLQKRGYQFTSDFVLQKGEQQAGVIKEMSEAEHKGSLMAHHSFDARA